MTGGMGQAIITLLGGSIKAKLPQGFRSISAQNPQDGGLTNADHEPDIHLQRVLASDSDNFPSTRSRCLPHFPQT